MEGKRAMIKAVGWGMLAGGALVAAVTAWAVIDSVEW
jgi:hypothetical protein